MPLKPSGQTNKDEADKPGCVQVYGLSGPVARYIGRNGPILHRFANEDVTLGAWLVGLEVTHVDERRFCCDSAERCMAQVRL